MTIIKWWRILRKRIMPDGTPAERLYDRFRLALVVIKQVGLQKFINNYGVLIQLYSPMQPRAIDIRRRNLQAYPKWIKANEPDRYQLKKQQEESRNLILRPLISIIIPVFNPGPPVFQDTLRSVLEQTYPYWELCLANASNIQSIKEIIDHLEQTEPRLKVVHLEKNLGISRNSNAALQLAHGQFVLLLDHDDMLAPDALFEIVNTINRQPDIDVLYYDEDKISADKRIREEPWFKPSTFSPSLLLSTNFLMHSAVRKEILDRLEGFNPEMDGAQDWDMALKLYELRVKMVHIPHVLYHWRRVPGSVASDANAKPWAYPAQIHCLEDHLARTGQLKASVTHASLGTIRIYFPVSGALVSIIIPSKDNLAKLKQCLDTILNITTYANYEILVIDNGSQEPQTLQYYQSLKGNPKVKLYSYPGTFNFHSINNQAARSAGGSYFVFLNNDTQPLTPEWLDELVGWLEQPAVGIVGAKLIRPNGTIQHGGIVMGLAGHGSHLFDGAVEPTYGPFGSTEWYRNCLAVTGACMAVRRDVFEKLGGFDEHYIIGYGDIDLCLRASQSGYRVIYTPFARVLHHEGATRGLSLPLSDVLRASFKMLNLVRRGDPFYSTNLSYLYRIPTIRVPSEPRRELTILKILIDFDLVSSTTLSRIVYPDWGKDETSVDWPSAPPRIIQKLLICSHELSLTGAPLILFNLAEFLHQQGMEIEVVSPLDGPLNSRYQKIGIPVSILPGLAEDPTLLIDHLLRCDAVLVNTIILWRSVHAARACGKACLWWIHESRNGAKIAEKIPGVQYAFFAATRVLFPTQNASRLYLKYQKGVPFLVKPFGIDLPVIEDQIDIRHMTNSATAFNVVNIASIERRKGQAVLLDAIERLPEQLKGRIQLFFIGRALNKSEPDYVKAFLRKVDRMPNAHFLGEMPHQEALAILKLADVFVLPSLDETLPISIIEAMAFGKSIIATSVGGIPEMIRDEINGLLVPPEKPEALAIAISRLMQEPELRNLVQKNALITYQESFSFSEFAKYMQETIQALYDEPQNVKLEQLW